MIIKAIYHSKLITMQCMLAMVCAVATFVCLSHASIVSKRINVGSCKQCHMIAEGLSFWMSKILPKFKQEPSYGGHQMQVG